MMQHWSRESIEYLHDAVAHSAYYRIIAEKIAPQLPPEAHVCDAGCGTGELSLALLPYCAHVTAVDHSPAAIAELEQRLPGQGLTALCAEIEEAVPPQPYDAMVFCLFGGMEETLRIAKRQCRGWVFLVKRDYTHHRFSADKIRLGSYTADRTEQTLREQHIPFQREPFSVEFGQPFRSLAAAERFFALYNRSKEKSLSPEEVAARLEKGPSPAFPYYLPHEKQLCLFSFQSKDIPEEM